MNSTVKIYAVISGILALFLVLALVMAILTQPKASGSRAASYAPSVNHENAAVRSNNTIVQSVKVK